jgi:hypothetical protein
MGLIDWFSGRRRDVVAPDSVWLTAAARLSGLCRRVDREAHEAQVLVLAHFPETLGQVVDALRGRTDVQRADTQAIVASTLASPRAGAVCLALVRDLPEQPPAIFGQRTTPVSMLVAERHPLRAEDDKARRLAAALPYPCTVRFHLSLDDPLLERFGGERLKPLLDQLGMNEEEELSHPTITRAVRRAQKQLARRAIGEIEATSVDDWLRTVDPE